MEPGHEDREYFVAALLLTQATMASMEPGHEDREYVREAPGRRRTMGSLNGARS